MSFNNIINEDVKEIPQKYPIGNEYVESLTELHAHLMGMGDHIFWVNNIILDDRKMPDDASVRKKLKTQTDILAPLIWDSKEKIPSEKPQFYENYLSIRFFNLLLTWGKENVNSHFAHRKKIFSHSSENFNLWNNFQDELQPIRNSAWRSETKLNEFFREIERYDLSFENDFSFEVVFSLKNLCKGLGVSTSDPEDLRAAKVEELLDIDFTAESPFKHKIIWNERKQCFQIVNGIPVSTLRNLILENKASRARVSNGFSMLNPDGTTPRTVDFHTFRGAFTPEFYPRRFALKDSLYEQRLDVLAYLLGHILSRYGSCVPPVKYVELSVGSGDIARPWILDVLSVFKSPKEGISCSFQNFINGGKSPWISSLNVTKFKVEYYFLAAFVRGTVNVQKRDVKSFLNLSPQVAISLMLDEINLSEKNEPTRIFGLLERALIDIENNRKNEFYNSLFQMMVVGLDLVGDEMGYPYCPFVSRMFLDFVRDMREVNGRFGVRVHAAENVPLVRPNQSGFRMYAAHMYILFLGIRFLIDKLCVTKDDPPIRIGHGIAFAFIFMNSQEKFTDVKTNVFLNHHKSSVLMSLINYQGNLDIYRENMIFEINPTSNYHLLRQNKLKKDCKDRGSVNKNPLYLLLIGGYKVTLSTDDDGIWPIDSCNKKHHFHHSLVAEYCNSKNIILESGKLILDLIQNAENAKFHKKNITFHFNNGKVATSTSSIPFSIPKEIITVPIWDALLKGYTNRIHFRSLEQYESIFKKSSKIGYKLVVLFAALYEFVRSSEELYFQAVTYQKIKVGNLDLPIVFKNCNSIYSNLILASSSETCKLELKTDCTTFFVYSMIDTCGSQKTAELNDILIARSEIEKKKRVEQYFLPDISIIDKKNFYLPPKSDTKIGIFSNSKKNKFVRGIIEENYELSINSPLYSRYWGSTEVPFLYCACPHGSASTLAFHLLAENIDTMTIELDQNPFEFIPYIPLVANSLPYRIYNSYLKENELHPLHKYAKTTINEEIRQVVPEGWRMFVAEIRSGKSFPCGKIGDLEILQKIVQGIFYFYLMPQKFEIISIVPPSNAGSNIPFPAIELNDKSYLLCTKVKILKGLKDITLEDIEPICTLKEFLKFPVVYSNISELSEEFSNSYFKHALAD